VRTNLIEMRRLVHIIEEINLHFKNSKNSLPTARRLS
jgi:hypothetical protein